MTRNEMIELLIMNHINDWVFAHNYNSLQEVLTIGWKGYNDYTNKELEEAIEEFDEKQIRDIKNTIKMEKEKKKLRKT